MDARVVFLSQDDMAHYVCDDDQALPAFADAGLAVETLSWRADADWSGYDGVIVRSTWDYQRNADAFFRVLDDIDRATRLANPLPLMRWNMDKRYLAELQSNGVPIVPTEFGDGLDRSQLDALIASADGESVIKPTISAGAERTLRVPADADATLRASVVAAHADTGWMWQPFLPQIVAEGEYSLFYFAGEYSHAILKTPRTGDFRVQEEFGGVITAVTPEAALRAAGDTLIAALPTLPLYARVDLVRGADDWMLIELELIEPSLYLRKDDDASARFAAATRRWLSA